MKKVIAYFLLAIFLTSSSVELCKDLCNKDAVSFSKITPEDDTEKKDAEKELGFEKDKIVIYSYSSDPIFLSSSSTYSTLKFLLLPSPYISKEVNPPNATI
jgi:hypothetical protein